MRLRAQRILGVFSLLALLAAPARTAVAATRHVAKTSVHATPHRKGTARAHAARRRGSRRHRHSAPPVGGVYARNAILIDPGTGQVLFEKNSSQTVPIASLTKLMTALVFLEQKPKLDHEAQVSALDLAGAGHTQLRKGENVALGDLLHMSLMCSDNVATRVIAREAGLSQEDFLERMNHKSAELGLTRTHFVEFTGLDERNVSSAADVARMLHAAAHDPLIQEITTTREYVFRTATRLHSIRNTDRLLYGDRYAVLGGKTGFIVEAGYCFATWIRMEGRDLIAVVLGAPTVATRFADAVRLIQKSSTIAATTPAAGI